MQICYLVTGHWSLKLYKGSRYSYEKEWEVKALEEVANNIEIIDECSMGL